MKKTKKIKGKERKNIETEKNRYGKKAKIRKTIKKRYGKKNEKNEEKKTSKKNKKNTPGRRMTLPSLGLAHVREPSVAAHTEGS